MNKSPVLSRNVSENEIENDKIEWDIKPGFNKKEKVYG